MISLVSILAGVLIPSVNPGLHEQLQSAAQIVCSDLAYARSLAITNGSKYRVTFDLAQNRYVLEHSGTDVALNTLPTSPFRSSIDTATKRYTDLDDLPQVGFSVLLHSVQTVTTPATALTTIEFDSVGATTQTAETAIWLAAGNGAARRYFSIYVNPVTGLARPGVFRGAP